MAAAGRVKKELTESKITDVVMGRGFERVSSSVFYPFSTRFLFIASSTKKLVGELFNTLIPVLSLMINPQPTDTSSRALHGPLNVKRLFCLNFKVTPGKRDIFKEISYLLT